MSKPNPSVTPKTDNPTTLTLSPAASRIRIGRGTLLFDEEENAHALVLDLLLQILDDAAITLSRSNWDTY